MICGAWRGRSGLYVDGLYHCCLVVEITLGVVRIGREMQTYRLYKTRLAYHEGSRNYQSDGDSSKKLSHKPYVQPITPKKFLLL